MVMDELDGEFENYGRKTAGDSDHQRQDHHDVFLGKISECTSDRDDYLVYKTVVLHNSGRIMQI